jgi:hypothetical protein
MTNDTQMRAIGKPKVEKDPNALKLASFRTKEGIWAEFCQKAESINLTATDVLKAAMDQFISGEYDPRVHIPSRRNDDQLSRHDVVDIVNGIVAETLAKLDPLSNAAVTTVINAMSLPSNDDVNTRIKAEIEPVAESLSELEAYTHGQFKTIREELQRAVTSKRSPK